MGAMRSVQAAMLVLALALSATARGDDKKKGDPVKDKLLGTWEVVEDKRGVVGTRVRFDKDGKTVMTSKQGAKEEKIEGTYAVDGKTLEVKVKEGDEEHVMKLEITTLDDKKLVLERSKGDALTLKKVTQAKKKE